MSQKPNLVFHLAPNTYVLTTREVLEGSPVELVVHDEDGDWQFLPLERAVDNLVEAKLVSLGWMLTRHPQLLELADLPEGWRAWKHAGRWERAPKV